jgi:SAM-dependent methyltransferase
MTRENIEASVRTCYSTWGETYYADYYGPKAPYPPVHRELIRRLLLEAGVANVLDAGCGPASFLRELIADGIDIYGFDLTPAMVAEARRVLSERGISPDHVWEGSVLSADSFRAPRGQPPRFDAALCVGVLPHLPARADQEAIQHLRGAVKPGGLVIVEARNQLFSLFTLNRYSHQFFLEELIRVNELKEEAGEILPQLTEGLNTLAERFRMDLPPVRKGKATEPGYDEVLSRTHNPLVLRQQFEQADFRDVQLLFYHYHCLPPMLQSFVPDLFVRESLARENPEDWRGYFMASAFLLAGKRA